MESRERNGFGKGALGGPGAGAVDQARGRDQEDGLEERCGEDGRRRGEEGGGRLGPLVGAEVCVGRVFLSAGVEGWGDRHGRRPGDPQTWRETK